ncbi:hypothetical protein [Actinomadura chokoriensis]|uniref:hypothetical protein n=1 Tax=Actinomadura chokoriensis TaxID=454156 RepID=UPI003566037B
MTASIIAFPGTGQPGPREWLARFAAAAVTSDVPAPMVRACRAGDRVPEDVFVHGEPVSVTVAGRMGYADIAAAWRRVWELAPAAGSRVRIAGGRVLVDLPDTFGGAA